MYHCNTKNVKRVIVEMVGIAQEAGVNKWEWSTKNGSEMACCTLNNP